MGREEITELIIFINQIPNFMLKETRWNPQLVTLKPSQKQNSVTTCQLSSVVGVTDWYPYYPWKVLVLVGIQTITFSH